MLKNPILNINIMRSKYISYDLKSELKDVSKPEVVYFSDFMPLI